MLARKLRHVHLRGTAGRLLDTTGLALQVLAHE